MAKQTYDVYYTPNPELEYDAMDWIMEAPLTSIAIVFGLGKEAIARIEREAVGKGDCKLHNCRRSPQGLWQTITVRLPEPKL